MPINLKQGEYTAPKYSSENVRLAIEACDRRDAQIRRASRMTWAKWQTPFGPHTRRGSLRCRVTRRWT